MNGDVISLGQVVMARSLGAIQSMNELQAGELGIAFVRAAKANNTRVQPDAAGLDDDRETE